MLGGKDPQAGENRTSGSGKIRRKLFQDIQSIVIIGSGFYDEFNLITGFDPPKIVRIIMRVHEARWAFDVHDPDAAAVNPGDVEAAIGFHQHRSALTKKLYDQIRGFFLKQRLSAGDFDYRSGRIGCNPTRYFGNRHVHAFFIGIPRITIGAPEVASGQANENTGQSGIQGFTLNAVKYFIDFK